MSQRLQALLDVGGVAVHIQELTIADIRNYYFQVANACDSLESQHSLFFALFVGCCSDSFNKIKDKDKIESVYNAWVALNKSYFDKGKAGIDLSDVLSDDKQLELNKQQCKKHFDNLTEAVLVYTKAGYPGCEAYGVSLFVEIGSVLEKINKQSSPKGRKHG